MMNPRRLRWPRPESYKEEVYDMGAALPVALVVVSAVVSAAQKISEGMTAAGNYEAQVQAAETKARVAAMNAGIAGSQGQIAAAQTARDWIKNLGRQRALMAQGGVLDSPTGLLVRQATEERAKGDEFQIQLNTDLNKQSYLFQSSDYLNQAAAARSNAAQAKLGGWLGGIGSFAGGLGKAYGMS
jgi:preprotein translocase subunit SecF